MKEYREDIDGMRAIAVWLVVLFHAGFSLFSGGYVGVDVFFVLSGYLITQQIVRQYKEGRFSFKEFYLRRIRRIIPVYLCVIFFSCLLGYFLLLPDSFIDHVKLAGLAFLSLGNFYIANTSGGYFEQEAESIFLLHTWSLSVEEQFYFVWPLMLFALLRFFRGTALHIALAGLLLAGVVLSEYMTQVSPLKAYYLLPARFFELLIGGMLAIVAGKIVLHARSAGLLALLGTSLIIYAGMAFDDATSFPGLNAAIPCLGAALLLLAGRQQYPFRSLLEHPVMVFFGKISYSMYLWHWVVFSAYRYAFGEMPVAVAFGLIVLTVALSVISWRWVEQPFRYNRLAGFKPTIYKAVVAPFVFFVAAYALIDGAEGMPGRFTNENYLAVVASKQAPLYSSCVSSACDKAVLIGDSHAGHFKDFVNVLASNAGVEMSARVQGGCAPLHGIIMAQKTKDGRYTYDPYECEGFNTTMLEGLDVYDYVVLSAYWAITQVRDELYFYVKEVGELPNPSRNLELLEEGLHYAITNIVEAGAVPVLLLDNVTMPAGRVQCVRRKLLAGYDVNCDVDAAFRVRQQQPSLDTIMRVKSQFPQLIIVDPNRVLCDEQHCYADKWGMPLYQDRDHLYPAAVVRVAEQYLSEVGNPFMMGARSGSGMAESALTQ